MRHSRIRLITALVAVAFAASGYIATREQGGSVQSTAQQENRQTYAPPSSAGAIADKSSAPKIYDPKCEKPKDHDEADLCVQREAVKSSEKAAWWAAFQSYVAIVGLVGVIASLTLAAWAANESRKGADAARRSADLSAIALATSNRPWIKVESVVISNAIHFYETEDGGTSVSAAVQIFYKNIGETVALNAGYKVWMLAAPVRWGRGESAADLHQEKCDEFRRILARDVLFPGEVSREFSDPTGGRGIGVESESLQRAITVWPDRRDVALIIGGIVTYNIAADDAVHHTTFHYALGYLNEHTRIPISPTSIPPENIRVFEGQQHLGAALKRVVT